MIQIMLWCYGLWSKSLAQTQRGDGGILLIDGRARGISRDQYAPHSCPRCVVQRTHMPQSIFTLYGRKLHVWMSVCAHEQSLNTQSGRWRRINYSLMHFCATRGLCCEWPWAQIFHYGHRSGRATLVSCFLTLMHSLFEHTHIHPRKFHNFFLK